jgi:hypothetical protein
MGDMGILPWLTDNAFNLFNALGIVGGLLFTGYSLHSEAKTRRVANLLALTEAHRNIWKEHLKSPQLARVLSTAVDLLKEPITREEEIFVNLIIQHTSVVFHTMRDELTIKPEGLRRDVASFFSLPIPQAVWEQLKTVQDDQFIAFVDSCRNWK